MNISKIWHLAQRKGLFVLQILFNMGIALISIMVSDFTRTAVDEGVGQGQLTNVFLKFMFFIVVGTALSYGNVICGAKFSNCFIEDLRNKSLKQLLGAKYNFYEVQTTGSISSRMNRDMEIVAEYMAVGMPEFASNMVIFMCCFIYLLTINPLMTLISAICIPMAVVLAKKVAAPTYDTMEKFDATLDEATQIVQDTIYNIKIEKVYGLAKVRKKYFDDKMDEATRHYVRYEKLVAKAGGYKYVIRMVPMFICVFMGFYNTYRGTITSGEMIAFVLLLQNISKPLSELSRYVTELKEAMVAMDRVMVIIGAEKESFGEEEAKESIKVFELEALSFAYPPDGQTQEERKYLEDNMVLSQVNMMIPKGQTIALVGPSGSGKSTIFKLLTGFHEPTKGQICLYGKPLKEWKIEKARRLMAYVAQETYLFEGTIAENIGYGKENATLAEIITAAKKAYAHDFIMAMPQGYQTVLSERGSNLSGGQRQRLGIARAFLKDAPIFILDEMTSALDVESERLIQKAIKEYRKNKTVILIAHRLSTIQDANLIYVLKDGRVVEQGDHKSLLAEGTVYSKLYAHQSSIGEEVLHEAVL